MRWLVRKHWQIAVVWACAIACLSGGTGAFADAYYDQGVKLYNQRDFKKAASYFEYATRANPADSNAFYYAALSYQQLNDWPRAKQMYRTLVEKHSATQAGALAREVLRKYDPEFLKRVAPYTATSSAGTSSSGRSYGRSSRRQESTISKSDYDRCPRESVVKFERRGNHQVVEAQVNGRSVEMYFDTGAADCAFGKNQLQEMGVAPPSGPSTGRAIGVGSSSPVDTWDMPVTFKVGNMEFHNFPISVQENLPTLPLLGQTFFKNFEVATDNVAGTITFRKKEATARFDKYDKRNVPFRKDSRNGATIMVVSAKVNGHPCDMYFDTGAGGVVFTLEQLRNLGMEIPADAEAGESGGIGGSTTSHHFHVNDIELGPLFKENVDVSVVNDAKMRFPLLGQTFFRDAEYNIDYVHNVIHFNNW